MSTSFLKKQAKRLSSLLPEHLKTHAESPAALSACQELIAKVNGFPNFHAAMTHPSMLEQPVLDGLPESKPPLEATVVAQSAHVEESDNPFLNPKQAIRGEVGYGPDAEIKYKGRYWLVDIGVNLDLGGIPMTAIVLDPLDSIGNGHFDMNLMLNRDDIREDVANKAMRDVAHLAMTRTPEDLYLKTIAKGSPNLFVLIVHERNLDSDQPYALCFDWREVGTFQGRVAIESDQFAPLYQQLQERHGVLAYERFVLREAKRCIEKRAQPDASNVVQVRESHNTFGKVMSFIQGCGQIAGHQRQFGLNLSLDQDGWLREAMADASRYDQSIRIAYGNMYVQGQQRPRVHEAKRPSAKPNKSAFETLKEMFRPNAQEKVHG